MRAGSFSLSLPVLEGHTKERRIPLKSYKTCSKASDDSDDEGILFVGLSLTNKEAS